MVVIGAYSRCETNCVVRSTKAFSLGSDRGLSFSIATIASPGTLIKNLASALCDVVQYLQAFSLLAAKRTICRSPGVRVPCWKPSSALRYTLSAEGE